MYTCYNWLKPAYYAVSLDLPMPILQENHGNSGVPLTQRPGSPLPLMEHTGHPYVQQCTRLLPDPYYNSNPGSDPVADPILHLTHIIILQCFLLFLYPDVIWCYLGSFGFLSFAPYYSVIISSCLQPPKNPFSILEKFLNFYLLNFVLNCFCPCILLTY